MLSGLLLRIPLDVFMLFMIKWLYTYAGSHAEGGGDGGEYGDYDVKDLAPSFFCHFFF